MTKTTDLVWVIIDTKSAEIYFPKISEILPQVPILSATAHEALYNPPWGFFLTGIQRIVF